MLQLDDHDGCGVYLTWRILLCVLQRVWSFVNHLQHLKLKDYTLPFIFNWKMGHPGGPELVFLQQPYCYCWVERLNSAHACQHASIPAWPLSHVCINCLALQALDFAILKIYYASNYINSLFAVTVVKVKMSVAQLCLTLCDPVDCSPPGSSVHGILSPGKNTGVGCHSLLQGIPDPGIEPRSLTLQADSLSSEPPGKIWW